MAPRGRDLDRRKFTGAVEGRELKIQVGARGSKNGPEWIAIDLFDKSPLIDHQWDLLNLPLEDQSVDCFVCNAILEHVFEPQLAIYEMYRSLKIGGQIWVEVPFNQFYHAHPYDFRRWTVQGLEWEMRRFDRVASGISGEFTNEIRKVAHAMKTEAKLEVDDTAIQSAVDLTQKYVEAKSRCRVYSGTYYWGTKTSHDISEYEALYMKKLLSDVKAAIKID